MNITLSDATPRSPLPDVEWIDSHVHFDVFDRAGLMEPVVERALGAGVRHMVAIGGSDEANERAVRLARASGGVITAVVGFDRDLAGKEIDFNGWQAFVREHTDVIVGVGESGLDYHYEPHTAAEQRQLFERMLDAAAEFRLPIVVHSREADLDTLEMLASFVRNWKGDPARPGLLHCFTGSYAFARKLLDLGLMISFSGILTFRNADDLRACAAKLPLDRLLIETDAPYLAPAPHRGKTNEPAWVFKVAETLASIRPDALQLIANQTTANARMIFQTAKEHST